jgi:hypothetical protein
LRIDAFQSAIRLRILQFKSTLTVLSVASLVTFTVYRLRRFQDRLIYSGTDMIGITATR